MNCEIAREALSAQLDGEELACPSERLEEHLTDCAACRQWQEAAHVVTRRARLSSASAVQDRTEEILAAVLADRARTSAERSRPLHGQGRVRGLLRAGLVAAAFAQFVLILPALIGHAGAGVPPHASRELGVFNLALATGFLAAAVRPALARGMIPVVGTAASSLVALSIADSAIGATTLSAETPHLITAAGWLLLFGLTRKTRTEDGRGPTGSSGERTPLRRRIRLGVLEWLRTRTTRPAATMGAASSAARFSGEADHWYAGDETGERAA
jgi:predicted anti-sigma-YlaC factor YlaD